MLLRPVELADAETPLKTANLELTNQPNLMACGRAASCIPNRALVLMHGPDLRHWCAGFIDCNFVQHLVTNTEASTTVLDNLTYAASREALGELPKDRVNLAIRCRRRCDGGAAGGFHEIEFVTARVGHDRRYAIESGELGWSRA